MCAAVFATVLPLPAHHSFIAEYDSGKPLSLTGIVTRVQWMNPHIWIYIDAKDAGGTIVPWQCEGGSPSGLSHMGWNKNTLKAGDHISIEGFPAKDMAHTCIARSAKLPDGRQLFSSSSDEAIASGRGKK